MNKVVQDTKIRSGETAKLVGAGAFIASLTESVVALLYLLFLRYADKFPHTPGVEFSTADNIEFVLAFLLPAPLFLLFILGLVLGIIGWRSPLGIVGLFLAVISPIWQGLWFLSLGYTQR